MTIWKADDGTLLYYELKGEASRPPLLLLPGLLGSISQQWRGIGAALAQSYFVISADLRGHGDSGNAAAQLLPERMLADISGLLDELGVDQVRVAGYDLGGYLGLQLALNQPRRVLRLMLHASKFYWTQETAASMRLQFDPDRLAQRAPSYAEQLSETHGPTRWRELARQAADLAAYLAQTGIQERDLAHLTQPVLVSTGDRDSFVPVVEAYRLMRALPGGQLLVLPNCNHAWASAEADYLLQAMRSFFA